MPNLTLYPNPFIVMRPNPLTTLYIHDLPHVPPPFIVIHHLPHVPPPFIVIHHLPHVPIFLLNESDTWPVNKESVNTQIACSISSRRTCKPHNAIEISSGAHNVLIYTVK